MSPYQRRNPNRYVVSYTLPSDFYELVESAIEDCTETATKIPNQNTLWVVTTRKDQEQLYACIVHTASLDIDDYLFIMKTTGDYMD